MSFTNKQRAFIEEYLKSFNATQAALSAGYSERSARTIGWENLNKPAIAAEIEARISELTMDANEVLIRLGEQARASMEDFVDIDDSGSGVFRLNLYKAQRRGKLHLIKSLTPTPNGYRLELHDSHAALVDIGRHLKLFTDKHELTGADGEPIALAWPEEVDNDRNYTTDPTRWTK